MPLHDVPAVRLPSGEAVPALGQGARDAAGHRERREEEIAALRLGLDLGLAVIDTTGAHAGGAAEELVGEAVAGRREEAFLVTGVNAGDATRHGAVRACERSLRRFGTDRLDLYLLHGRGLAPLDETVEAFTELAAAGKIRHWGVSDFGAAGLAELAGVPGGGRAATARVTYGLTRRGAEHDLLPWCRRHGLPVTACPPPERGRPPGRTRLAGVAARHGVTSGQVALAWLLHAGDVLALPGAATPDRVLGLCASLEVRLTAQDLAELDRAFPRPEGPLPTPAR